MPGERTGVWFIGALGSVATTAIAGARALARGLASSTGLLTETEPFRGAGWVDLDRLVFGGHEIRKGSLGAAARQIHRENGSISSELLGLLDADLDGISGELRDGVAHGCGPAVQALAEGSPAAAGGPARPWVDRLARDLAEFRDRHSLGRLVVVNLASTEPPIDATDPVLQSPEAFESALDLPEPPAGLRSGALYAAAAFRAGAAFVNFTPSGSSLCPATLAMADARGLPYAGSDGKTGETLVKSVLAPLFRYRNLKVLSWLGYNLLGNRDGLVLDHPDHKQSKVQTKDATLSQILGYRPQTRVGIDYVPSLHDSKVAWDFIQFAGFLDWPMTLSFTWQGCDSILAAPLVLDLVRFMDDALRRKVSGPQRHLACFFKAPLGCTEYGLHAQFEQLVRWLGERQAAAGEAAG